jgi:hypothetical protein
MAATARGGLSQHQALLQLARGGGVGAQLTPYNFAGTSMAYTAAQANATYEIKKARSEKAAAAAPRKRR